MYSSFSTASLFPMEVENAVHIAVEIGYKHLELFINSEYEFSDEFIFKIRNYLDPRGVIVDSIHPYLSGAEPYLLFSEYEFRRMEIVKYYKRCIASSSRFGAKYFILHGPGLSPRAYRDPNRIDLEVYSELINYGNSCGITVLQENVALFLSSYPEYLFKIAEELPSLSFNLDIKQAYRTGTPVRDFINAMHGRIRNVHINDIDDSGHCRLPGEGKIDYLSLLSLLAETGYSEALVTEVYRGDFDSLSRLPVSKEFLESKIKTISEVKSL